MDTAKYPRALSKIETTSRRQYDLEKIKLTKPADATLLTKKGTFTFANAYPYIFDALSALCTEYATAKYKDAKGIIRNVIERQDNDMETHYRSILTIDTFSKLALNGHIEYWDSFLIQLHKLALNPEKKVLPFMDGYSILTEPVRIDLVTENGDKLTAADKDRIGRLPNRSKKAAPGERVSGKIALIMIEFYKPLFSCLLNKNKKGEIGFNYIQVPKGLQAEIKATAEQLRINGFFNGKDISAENVPMYEMDARAIFLYLAQHDNHQGNHITIDAIDFAESCFPGDVKITQEEVQDESTGKTEIITKKYISKADGFKIRSKIKKTIVTFKQMGKIGKMNGGQFIPLSFIELDETTVQYDHGGKKYQIKILRPKNPAVPMFSPEEIEALEEGIKSGAIPS